MSVTALYHPARAGSVERYLSPKEEVRYATRRHVKVLDAPTTLWFASLALFLTAVASERGAGPRLTPFAFAVFSGASGFLLCRALQWATTQYVFTTERVLLIEGILGRKVNGIPMRLVIDTVYRQPFAGRLLGYGHLELNLSGKPGIRTLTWLPDLDMAYKIVLVLARGHELELDEGHDDPGKGSRSPIGHRSLVPLNGGPM